MIFALAEVYRIATFRRPVQPPPRRAYAKDNHSRSGPLMMVAQCRKLLDCLKGKSDARY